MIKSGERRVLILDYDGTLAPFVVKRDEAYPYPGVMERLERIIEETNTRLIIVSGREIKDLLPLLKTKEPIEIWGSHGVERRMPDGTYFCQKPSKQILLALKEAENVCSMHLPKSAYEVKPASIAVHTRGGFGEVVEEEIIPAFAEIAFDLPLELHSFNQGVELRLDYINKGVAVREILKESSDNMVAYLGDDATDEEAFEALKNRGLKILVSRENKKTLADIRISPPEELLKFLDEWIEYGFRIN